MNRTTKQNILLASIATGAILALSISTVSFAHDRFTGAIASHGHMAMKTHAMHMSEAHSGPMKRHDAIGFSEYDPASMPDTGKTMNTRNDKAIMAGAGIGFGEYDPAGVSDKGEVINSPDNMASLASTGVGFAETDPVATAMGNDGMIPHDGNMSTVATGIDHMSHRNGKNRHCVKEAVHHRTC